MEGENTHQIDYEKIGLELTNHISAMLAYWDENLVCRFANNAYLDWFGKAREKMINCITLNELLGPTLFEKNAQFIYAALKGENQTFERELHTPSGEIRYSLANYIPYFHNGKQNGFFVHVADITSVKKLEKEIAKTKELEIKNKELEKFAYITSHDLKTPLQNISNYITIIDQDFSDSFSEELKTYFSIISKSSTQMSKMINALLNHSLLGNDFSIELVDLNQLIKVVVENLDVYILKEEIEIHIDPLPKLFTNEIVIFQVFMNLLQNAIKFRKKDIKIEIKIKCEKKDNEWLFSINDNGIGIDSKYFEQIFQIFKRLNNADNYEGYGIGLANTKKIIENQGGNIWLESKINEGTTFYFTLPISYEKEN